MKAPAPAPQAPPRATPLRGAATRVPARPQSPFAAPGVHPPVAVLKPGCTVALEARGFEGEVAWRLEAPQGAHLLLRHTPTGQLLLEMAPSAQLDEIIFVRAYSRKDPRLMARSSVRLLPQPDPPEPAAAAPAPLPHRGLLGILGDLLRV